MDIKQDCRGFGRVQREVMRDTSIGVGEKGLYAYLCSYAGDKLYCYPPKDLICRELGITRGTLNKYISGLCGRGYLATEMVRTENGKFKNTRYTLYAGGEKTGGGKTSVGKTGGGKTGVGKTSVGKTSVGKMNANNNKYNNNNLNNNNLNNNTDNNNTINNNINDCLREEHRYEEEQPELSGSPLLCGTLPFGV